MQLWKLMFVLRTWVESVYYDTVYRFRTATGTPNVPEIQFFFCLLFIEETTPSNTKALTRRGEKEVDLFYYKWEWREGGNLRRECSSR